MNTNTGCVCNCKDTNLKAIHNLVSELVASGASCVCNCKDTNLKAIHNRSAWRLIAAEVVFATAKILIWKQFTTQAAAIAEVKSCCVCNCKDTNLKAIHNQNGKPSPSMAVVFATAKILIWKQFTTESNVHIYLWGCVCNCKDTNLKAIHNIISVCQQMLLVVFATAKILIWKQFTTTARDRLDNRTLCLQLQRY